MGKEMKWFVYKWANGQCNSIGEDFYWMLSLVHNADKILAIANFDAGSDVAFIPTKASHQMALRVRLKSKTNHSSMTPNHQRSCSHHIAQNEFV
jgi:hypothetical protein